MKLFWSIKNNPNITYFNNITFGNFIMAPRITRSSSEIPVVDLIIIITFVFLTLAVIAGIMIELGGTKNKIANDTGKVILIATNPELTSDLICYDGTVYIRTYRERSVSAKIVNDHSVSCSNGFH